MCFTAGSLVGRGAGGVPVARRDRRPGGRDSAGGFRGKSEFDIRFTSGSVPGYNQTSRSNSGNAGRGGGGRSPSPGVLACGSLATLSRKGRGKGRAPGFHLAPPGRGRRTKCGG